MTATIDILVTLLIVGGASGFIIFRICAAVSAQRGGTGCGSACACPTKNEPDSVLSRQGD